MSCPQAFAARGHGRGDIKAWRVALQIVAGDNNNVSPASEMSNLKNQETLKIDRDPNSQP